MDTIVNNMVFTVTELNGRIKTLLDSDPTLSSVYVRGELSNYKVYPSGHHYFTLKDKESSLRCVMFRSHASRLRFKPESGMQATILGNVTVYPRDGAYQLYCVSISPEGMGDLHAAFEQLKTRLMREGLFDKAHKKPIPHFPGRIGVITSSAGAAVRDIIRVLGKRWPLAKVLILPVRVQGEEAPAEIAGALRYANEYDVADLIITGRGGGSIEDLWAFNDERVARAIYQSGIPVISAVGHEPDVTIADYVADLRAATPSNAAELAVPDIAEMRELVSGFGGRADRAMAKRLEQLSHRLRDLSGRRVLTDPVSYVGAKGMELDFIRSRLLAAAHRLLDEKKHAYVKAAAFLDALSPLRVLSRGYAIASNGRGELIRRESQVEIGESINLRLWEGTLACRVEEKTAQALERNGQ